MKRWIGPLLMATAVLHTVVGFIFFAVPLADVMRAGVLNAVDPHYDRAAAIWFLLFGALLWLLGMLAQWSVQQTGTVPASLGWGLAILGLVGVVLMPVSGFWLVLPQAYIILRVAYQPGKPVRTAV